MDQNSRFLTVSEAAKLLDITPNGVREMESRGALPLAFRTASGWRIFERATVQQLAERRRSSLEKTDAAA
jgi:DNA-binding transcriptional MerR regulator